MEFMGRKIVTTCDGAVPTTASGKSCSNGNYRRRQTHGIGSLQEKLWAWGTSKGWSESQWGL